MCAKPLVSFYEELFAFAAAFVAAVALGFTVSYKNSIAAVAHPQRSLILCHQGLRFNPITNPLGAIRGDFLIFFPIIS